MCKLDEYIEAHLRNEYRHESQDLTFREHYRPMQDLVDHESGRNRFNFNFNHDDQE